ncbi:DUF4393 domain-containing protein [Metaclostridioides mangenotii]|uniref:DUF4393 domain-containing protein n=1 Tax=Metaclostridioides mangenotii TaxID=1540 RepID=A0ABS4E729_9FIRM|nr:DUF4393 domain-containing protein [Clostridioides mangenotii]MBP1853731.1 hypothetical protein [Clostridioides mangenotii]
MIKISEELDALGATGKILAVAPELYDDVVQPTAKETGKTISIIPKAINAALVPLRQWISYKEYNLAKTEKLLAYKLENLSPEKIVSPEPYVAVPALQAISYSMNNDELRNLYANLIAKSMNLDTKDTVHPAFVEIVKQLSPLDAILLKKLADTGVARFGIVKARVQESASDESGIDWVKHIINPIYGMNLSNVVQYQVSLENLQRLELINITYDRFLSSNSEYVDIENSDIITYCKAKSSSVHEMYSYFKCNRGHLSITNLGNSFNNICIRE